MPDEAEVSEIVEAEGHLIDSQLLNSIFDKVIERDSKFEVARVQHRPDQRGGLAPETEGHGQRSGGSSVISSRS